MAQVIGLVGLVLSVVALLFSVWTFRAIGHANKRIQAANERKIGEARGMRITKLDFEGHPTGEYTAMLPGKVTITADLDADKPE